MLAAVAAGYFLGAIPFAQLAARVRGVDIFSTGNSLAGTANVFWNVGRRTGALVFVGDVAKGALAVLVARALDVPPPLMLVAGGAAVLGHWKSVFTSFRGGDGMAPLMGVSLALAPPLATLGAAVGVAVIVLSRRSVLRSTWGVSACFMVMLGTSQFYHLERDLVSGLFVLASLVLARSMFTRRRRVHAPAHETEPPGLDLPVLELKLTYKDGPEDVLLPLDSIEGGLELDDDPDLNQAAPGRR